MFTCDRCGKKTVTVKTGAHKHGGAWAMRAPKVRKVMRPNLQRVKVKLNGQLKRYWLCTKCLKTLKKDQKLIQTPSKTVNQAASTAS